MNAEEFQNEVLQLERLMYRVAWAYLHHDADCADAMQETLIRAWQRRNTLRDRAQFRPWLMRILVNQCSDMLRRRKRRGLVSLEAVRPQVQKSMEGVPIREAMEALPAKLRVTVTLHYWEGYSVEETARMLGIPSGTVKSRLRSARKALCVLLREEWEEE